MARLLVTGSWCGLCGILTGTTFGLGETLLTWNTYGFSHKGPWWWDLFVGMICFTPFGFIMGLAAWAVLTALGMQRRRPHNKAANIDP